MRKPAARFMLLLLIALHGGLFGFAQTAAPAMADTMRSNGKIYVVVAVCLTILFGLFLYVFIADRKITRLEKELQNDRHTAKS